VTKSQKKLKKNGKLQITLMQCTKYGPQTDTIWGFKVKGISLKAGG